MNDSKIKSLPRKSLSPTRARANVIKAGSIEMDLARRRLQVGNRAVDLAWKDFELLKALLEARGGVVSREFLLAEVWGYDKPADSATRLVDVHILRLRNKLGPDGHRILTVRKVGYRFDVCLEWIKFGV